MNNSGVTSRYPPLGQLVAEVADLRPIGSAASRILHITHDERFSVQDLATAISSDQALTARLLRLSNSAYYEFPRRIATVREAIVLIGFRDVRAVTLASCVIEALPGSSAVPIRQFWHFSVAVAMLAEILARAARYTTDEAFTAGILHNIGRLALDQHHPDMLAAAVRRATEARTSVSAAERELFGYSDADLGGGLARRWNFPPRLVDAVAHHEFNPDALPDPAGLTALLVRARLFARSSGLSDGVEPVVTQPLDDEVDEASISRALARTGGIEAIRERAAVFLDHAVSA